MCANIKLLLFAARHHAESLSFAPCMIIQYAHERMQMPRGARGTADDGAQVTINGRPRNKIGAASIVSY